MRQAITEYLEIAVFVLLPTSLAYIIGMNHGSHQDYKDLVMAIEQASRCGDSQRRDRPMDSYGTLMT